MPPGRPSSAEERAARKATTALCCELPSTLPRRRRVAPPTPPLVSPACPFRLVSTHPLPAYLPIRFFWSFLCPFLRTPYLIRYVLVPRFASSPFLPSKLACKFRIALCAYIRPRMRAMFNDDVLHTPLVLAPVGLNECSVTEVVIGGAWAPSFVGYFFLFRWVICFRLVSFLVASFAHGDCWRSKSPLLCLVSGPASCSA